MSGETVWMGQLLTKYNNAEAHTFVLHMNVQDYVVPGRTLSEYLTARLARQDLIVHYDITRGITFPGDSAGPRTGNEPTARDLALRMLGRDGRPAEGSPDAAMREALSRLGGPGAPMGAGDLPRAPGDALPVLEQLLTHAGDHPFRADQRRGPRAGAGRDPVRVTLILDFAEAVVPAGDWATMRDADRAAVVSLQRWALDKRIGDNGSMILLVARTLSDLHPAIRAASAKCEPIEIPLPNLEARRDYIDRLCRDLEQNGAPLCWQDGLTPQKLANGAAGLGLVHIEDIVFRARAAGAITADLVRARKRDIISSEFGDLLEIVEPRFGWERVGGMEHIKKFFNASVITPLRSGARRRLPMGVLLVGPPGTGKSLVAEAVAREAGVNFVLLRMGKILGSYVGQSERNLEKALRCIESLAPMICFIDEIDQAIPGRSSGAGDSGVGGRIFGRLLDFIANPAHRGSILWLANTNRVDKLDPALTRPGRFDKIVPFLVPDPNERAHTLAVIAATHELAYELPIADEVVANTENWTGAELEAAVLKALELVEDEGLGPQAALLGATRSLAPATAGLRELSELAIRATNDRDLLPPRLRAQAGAQRDEEPPDPQDPPEQTPVSTRRPRSLA